LFGLAGLLITSMMQWMTLQRYAIDPHDKHGISEMRGSRLGGVALAISIVIFMAYNSFLTFQNSRGDNYFDIDLITWFGVACFFILGLSEDFNNNSISPKLRLVAQIIIMLGTLLVNPLLIPYRVGIEGLDWLLSFPLISPLLCIFFSVGFVNAVNTSDGANGLAVGIFGVSCFIFFQELGTISFQAGLYAASLFFLFNVISGRLFLGDAGAYSIGSALALTSLGMLSSGLASLTFLATLFFYPCVDFLVSLTRRFLNGRALMAPDNDHFHNRLHAVLRRQFRSRNLANSITGISIVIGSSGIALYFYEFGGLSPLSNDWVWLFSFQSISYGILFYWFGSMNAAHRQADEN
jgi:UDP-N-acetylmuramyl pentapeptide phosphotransferase/UDP-N-acetylglucosamine-1-phosphate transferase